MSFRSNKHSGIWDRIRSDDATRLRLKYDAYYHISEEQNGTRVKKDGKEYVARLWKHEIERALTDKLDCTSDQTMAESYIQETVSEALADVKHLSTQHFGKYYFGAFPLEESIESEEF